MSAVIATTVQDVAVVMSSEPNGDVVLDGSAPDGEQPVRLTMPSHVWVSLGSPQAVTVTLETRCRVCGCTDSQGCYAICAWVAPALCSECV